LVLQLEIQLKGRYCYGSAREMVCNRKHEKPAGLNSCVDSLMINR
jgi:hypothetical protein